MPLTHSLAVHSAKKKKGKERRGKALSFSLEASVREPEQEGNPTKSAVCSAWRGVKQCHTWLLSSCSTATGGVTDRKCDRNVVLLWNSVQIIHLSKCNMKGTHAQLKHRWKLQPVTEGYSISDRLLSSWEDENKNRKLFPTMGLHFKIILALCWRERYQNVQ